MTLEPLGDSALVLSWGLDVDDSGISRARAVTDALARAAIPGVIEVVPTFATVTVFYDVTHTGPYPELAARITALATSADETTVRAAGSRSVDIPVCYGGVFGPDLELIASRAGVGLDRAIELHCEGEYRVHAIGFVPGFAYLGGLPRKLHAPRRVTPRAHVAPGSVGIGGAQTGIYPVATPGGWNVIGRTPVVMFATSRAEPGALRMGDRVKFRAISPEEFAAWK